MFRTKRLIILCCKKGEARDSSLFTSSVISLLCRLERIPSICDIDCSNL